MAAYQFAPTLSKEQNHSFVSWNDAFTAEELEKIKEYGLALRAKDATIGDNEEKAEESIRRSKVSWVGYNDESAWIYDRLAFVGRKLNAKFYDFDLYGFLEDMQFTIYEETDNSHYSWHVDMSDSAPATRKFTLVLQLSDPSEYEGGDLQVMSRAEADTVDKVKGKIVGFPSYTLHRVTPVTKGTRYSLVVWICGPSFR